MVLKAGAAKARITPALNTPLAGYATERCSTGVADELYARAVVLQDETKTALILSLDVIAVDQPYVKQLREKVNDNLGILYEKQMAVRRLS